MKFKKSTQVIATLIIFIMMWQTIYAVKEVTIRNCTNSRIKINYCVDDSCLQNFYLESGEIKTIYQECKHYNFTLSMDIYACGKNIWRVYNDSKKAGGFLPFLIMGNRDKTLTYEIYTGFTNGKLKILRYRALFHNNGNSIFDDDDIEGRSNMSINDIVNYLLKQQKLHNL